MGGRLVEIHSAQQYEHVATLTTESQGKCLRINGYT